MRMRAIVICALVLAASACGSATTGGTSHAPAGTQATDTPAQRAGVAAAYERSRLAAAQWATRTKGCFAKARSGRFDTPGEALHCIETAYDDSRVERRLDVLEATLAASEATLADGACRTATVRWITTFPRFIQALRLVHAHDTDLDELSAADMKLLRRLAHPFNAARRRYLASC